MAKNTRHDPTPAEEYFAQLSWQQRFWRRKAAQPSRSDPEEPNWRYKIVYPKSATNSLFIVISRTIFVIAIFFVVYLLLEQAITSHSGLATFILVLMLITGAIFWFAIKDVTRMGKKSKTKADEDEIF